MNVYLRLLFATGLLLPACADRDPKLDQPLQVRAPVEVGGSLLLLDTTRERIDVVGSTGHAPTLSHLAFAGQPTQQVRTADGARLLWLDTPARKVSVATPTWVRSQPLGSPFSGLQLSDDGAYAVAWHTPQASADALVNPAEVALLDAQGLAPPRAATITGLARQALAAHVSPPVDLPGGQHRLVWVDAPSMMGLADFGPTGVRTAVVQLTASAATTDVTPRASVARVQPNGIDLYVVAQGTGDVLHLRIGLSTDQIDVSIDQIAAGTAPVDLHVYEQKSGGLRVLTANAGSHDVALLDPTTGTGFTVALDIAPAKILPFTDGTHNWAAIWAPGYSSLSIADLDQLAKKKGKALSLVTTEQPIRGIVPAGARLLLLHDSATAGLSIYDAGTTQLTSFKGTGQVVDLRVVAGNAYLLGSTNGQSRISRISLSDLHGSSLTMAESGAGLHTFGTSGIAISGQGLGGWWLATFPDGTLDASKANFLEGFTLSGIYGGVQ